MIISNFPVIRLPPRPTCGPAQVIWHPYIKSDAVRGCPSYSKSDQWSYAADYAGYGMNLSFDTAGVSLAQISKPSETILFADSNAWNDANDYMMSCPYLNFPSGLFPTIHARHLQTANAVFADGHVKAQRPRIAFASYNFGVTPALMEKHTFGDAAWRQ